MREGREGDVRKVGQTEEGSVPSVHSVYIRCTEERTCSSVGISPVASSQKSPSGSGSAPPGALGRSF